MYILRRYENSYSWQLCVEERRLELPASDVWNDPTEVATKSLE